MTDQATPPSRQATAPALVGRDRELALLRDHLASTRAGHGWLVLIGGEAGIGKTALVETLCGEAVAQGALVLIGRCYDLAETPPYGPWAEIFTRAVRDGALPASPLDAGQGGGAGSTGQQSLFARVREALVAVAGHRPLVVLLEDLHWADPASLDLLRYLGHDLDMPPLLLLTTYRADEVARRHPLYGLLPTLVREARAARLDLRPLGIADLRALVAVRYPLRPPTRGDWSPICTSAPRVILSSAASCCGLWKKAARCTPARDAGNWLT